MHTKDMKYVDGFVIAVPKKKINAYKKMAQEGRDLWMRLGALEYFECVGDDFNAPWALPFPKMMKLKPDETVVFSWITYKSKAHRDSINKKMMKEMEEKNMPKEMPFDMKRMAYGGFKVMVSN